LLLERFPARWNHLAEKESLQINMLEHVPTAKPLHTLAGHALTKKIFTGEYEYKPCVWKWSTT
jgi:hypothetical protein